MKPNVLLDDWRFRTGFKGGLKLIKKNIHVKRKLSQYQGFSIEAGNRIGELQEVTTLIADCPITFLLHQITATTSPEKVSNRYPGVLYPTFLH